MVQTNSAGKCLYHTIQLIIIILILGWNSLKVPINLYYYKQLIRYLNQAGSEPVICEIQVDILSTNLQILLHDFYILYWFNQYFRPKPPWIYISDIHTAQFEFTGVFMDIIIRIIANKNKFFTLYPCVLHDLSTFIACSLLHILIFHPELNFCSIRMFLGLLIVENIDIPYHNQKRSSLFHKICRSQGIIRSSTHLHGSVRKPPWLYSHILMLKEVHFEILEDANLPTKTDHE